MSTNQISLPEVGVEQRAKEIRSNLRRIGRYNWSLWVLAVVIALSLTFAIATLSMEVTFDPHNPFRHFGLSPSVRGLVGMVLLFSVYTLYQQFQLMRTRRRLAEQVEISTEQHLLAESYLKLAMLDPLTGLHNRRYAQDRLMTEIARAQRQRSSLTVLTMDVDDLKRINDRWGHGAGDLVLKTFGDRLSKAIRGSDLAVRIGGDEFVALLPECDPNQVQHVLGRLSALEIQIEQQKISFRFSAGWTDYQPGETPDQFLERADHALYVEKQNRKNQAVPVG
ncbi:MAG TPA: GGDEF domain-containing protein [Candidatus Acidoferrales bacterium]|jgi:diguanylate cyclase (GGDEF)-like protein|nr:GGDEF domain-containing protein [Candidatus Acidoferrales bacterium]